jgi:hypothetical protein
MIGIKLNYPAAGIDERLALAETALQFVTEPLAADATGTAGQLAYADGFLYVCIAPDTWQRAVLATWGA